MNSYNVSRRQFIRVVTVLATGGIAGCIGGGEDDDHSHGDEHHDTGFISDLRIIDRGEDEIVAEYHGHWHGNLPSIPLGEHISLGAIIENDAGDDVALGADDDYQLGVRVADDADAEIVNLVHHGDHVHLQGEVDGETAVIFQLLQNDQVEWETSESIHVDVVDSHDDGSHHDTGMIPDLKIIDRSTDNSVANYHGHWHGGLPTVPVDQHISLGAIFTDTDGKEISLNGSEGYRFGVRIADDADDSVVNLVHHGDHVHLQGEADGETAVLFQLLQDEEVEWESSESIHVDVVDE